MRITLITFIYFFSFAANAAVYRSLDEHGNVVYTDKPVAGAKEITVTQPTVTPSFKLPKKTEALNSNNNLGATQKNESRIPVFAGYNSLHIEQPVNDNALRQNDGNVEIVVKLDPQLKIQLGHQFNVILDNSLLPGSWTQTRWIIENLDRGTHVLQVRVTDKSGKQTFFASKPVTFHLQRAFIQ